ncbi:hypothetical protein [Flavobacterium marginilacus]|uniref:hypothetical protein n=1 Tax=Flavobacterium marginilacus TaxID=3003256 RepID=UPI00248E669D|nr:hypothetical protein [Flavobacterium marginilacus]
MKIFLNKALYKGSILFFLLYGFVIHADPNVPGDPDYIPPPPDEGDLPIDENITILIFIAVIFGLYIIYNHKLNKKRPI